MTIDLEASQRHLGRRRTRLLLVASVALLADAVTKAVGMSLLGSSSIGPRWAHLRVVRNPGFAFGIGARLTPGAVLATTIVVVAVVAGVSWRGRMGGPVAAGLIVGGAIANVLDRAVGGSVVDLIDVGLWPTFNLADVLIVVGVGMLVVRGREERRGRRTRTDVASVDEGLAPRVTSRREGAS